MTILEINTILNLLIAYNLTADELLLVYLTFLAQEEEGHPEFFAKWFGNGGKSKLKDLFESLKQKGIIHKDYNPKTYNPDDIEFNKNFLKSWLKGSGEMGMELFHAYPPYLTINGKSYPLRNIAKKFNSIEDFSFHYGTQIKHNPEKHKEIMELLEWAKENNKINIGILEFVCSHGWDSLQYLKDHPQEGQVESTFNVYESV